MTLITTMSKFNQITLYLVNVGRLLIHHKLKAKSGRLFSFSFLHHSLSPSIGRLILYQISNFAFQHYLVLSCLKTLFLSTQEFLEMSQIPAPKVIILQLQQEQSYWHFYRQLKRGNFFTQNCMLKSLLMMGRQ